MKVYVNDTNHNLTIELESEIERQSLIKYLEGTPENSRVNAEFAYEMLVKLLKGLKKED